MLATRQNHIHELSNFVTISCIIVANGNRQGHTDVERSSEFSISCRYSRETFRPSCAGLAPRGDQNAPIVDMVIYFNRREDMERFRDKWAGKTREHKVKLHGWRAALYALRHPKTDMIAYEKSDEPSRANPKKPT